MQVKELIDLVLNEYVPITQSEQTAEPVASLYVPGTHDVQMPPSGPVNPALQLHVDLELSDFEFAGQVTQVLTPVTLEYASIGHCTQVEE